MVTNRPAFGGRTYDVAVIGGGVIGCAVARRATLEGASAILIEAAADILAGASRGNSGMPMPSRDGIGVAHRERTIWAQSRS